MTSRSVVFRDVDMKMCQTKCIGDSFTFAFCRLTRKKFKKAEKTSKSITHPEHHHHASTVSCGFKVCSETSKCVNEGCQKTCMEAPSLCELHNTSDTGDLTKVKLILSKGGADINCQEWIGRTPVMWAAGKGYTDVVDLLLSRGADVSLSDRFGMNILHAACIGGDEEVVKYVLSHNMVDINSRVGCGRTPVMLAADNGHKAVVELLVGKGAGVSFVDYRRNGILHLACHSGDLEVVKYIVSLRKVDINSRGWRKKTPVMVSGESGHKQVVELLVNNGAKLSVRDRNGNTILHLVCHYGHEDVGKYVLSRHILDINVGGWEKRTPVMVAGKSGHKQVVELLVNHGANMLLRDREGNNILHLACYEGHVDVVKYILSGNMVGIESRGPHGKTAAMVAGERGHKEVVELLVNNGANLSYKDRNANNILHLACFHGHVHVVKYVLSLNMVDINSRGWKKRTPVMVAEARGHKQLIDLLMKYGAYG